jgi:hypothetical protein
MKLLLLNLLTLTTLSSYCQDTSSYEINTPIILQDQYGKSYQIKTDSGTTYLLLFKGNRNFGTNGVMWARALNDTLKNGEIFYPVMEQKKMWRWMPLFIKKHIITNHLQDKLENEEIKDKHPEETHPIFIIDWKNRISKAIGRKENGVWVLKYKNGKLIHKSEGIFTFEKFQELLNAK